MIFITGNNCVADEKFLLTILRWTIKVFNLFIYARHISNCTYKYYFDDVNYANITDICETPLVISLLVNVRYGKWHIQMVVNTLFKKPDLTTTFPRLYVTCFCISALQKLRTTTELLEAWASVKHQLLCFTRLFVISHSYKQETEWLTPSVVFLEIIIIIMMGIYYTLFSPRST